MPETPPLEARSEAALFSGRLACDVMGVARIEPGPAPAHALAEAERLFGDLAALDERGPDTNDEGLATDPAFRRLEAKVDLLLQLIARALPGPPVGVPGPLRLSALGLRLDAAAPCPPGEAHLVWQLDERLPLVLRLPVVPLERAEATRYWRFGLFPEPLQEALERHLFRLHRRALAASRRE